MKKILTIAMREYRAMVGTKAFLAMLVMMPVLMLGSLFAMSLLQNVGDLKTKKIAVYDEGGSFFGTLKISAASYNAQIKDAAEKTKAARDGSKIDGQLDEEPDLPGFSKDLYEFELIEATEMTDAKRLELSKRVRNQELYAFIEIPRNAAEMDVTEEEQIRFYSQDSSLSDARRWVAAIISKNVQRKRLTSEGYDPDEILKIERPVPVRGLGLVTETTAGEISSAEEADNPLKAIFLPMGVMMLMFMVIFMASQPMLESVLEEKSQRIAEVLLGSANPVQLMTGKLIGTVCGSLTIFGFYMLGAYCLAMYRGWGDNIPFHIIPWFLVFQIVGVLFYASIFMAVGASVSQLKEAQSMLLPVWMLLMAPMFIWIFIVREPLGPIATWFSLFPPATPTTMVLRMATGHEIPVWQPILGLILTLIATAFIVVLSARIYRVGILWQGKTPKISEIVKWAFTGS